MKIIGMVYRIALGNAIGQEGMSYLNSAYNIYQFLLSLFVSGGAVAVGKMVAESAALGRYAEVKKTIRIILVLFFIAGMAGMMILFFGSGWLAGVNDIPQAKYSLMVLSPAILFLALSCVFRGYFQGLQNMRPTGLSQIIEAVCKLAIGVGLAFLLERLQYAKPFTAAAALSGTTISTFIGLGVVSVVFFLPQNRLYWKRLGESGTQAASAPVLIKRFWRIAAPIMITSIIVNMTGVLDTFFIMNRLQSTGIAAEAAQAMYGAYTGYAQTLYNLAPSIIASLNTGLVPALSAAVVSANFIRARYLIERALKLVIIFSLPCMAGLFALAGPIQRLLFFARVDEVAFATPLLQILSLAVVFTSLATLSTGLLQSIQKMRVPVYALAAGVAVKVIANYILIGIPSIGMAGASVGTILCYATIFTINILCLWRNPAYRVSVLPLLVKPLISAVLMGAAAYGIHAGLALVVSDKAATVAAIVFAVIVYGLLMLVTGGIREADVLLLPKGAMLARLLKKLRLLRTAPADTAAPGNLPGNPPGNPPGNLPGNPPGGE